MHRRLLAPILLLAGAQMTQAQDDDPYLWLEEVHEARAMEWVEARNAETAATLQVGEDHDALRARLLAAFESDARIPFGSLRNGFIYNLWQDGANPRGLWRRTPVEAYAAGNPEWETLLDLDALGAAEQENWVFKGAACAPQDSTRCLLSLSRGGADAVVLREFDLSTRRFVADGFTLPEAKGGGAWLDEDTLLVQSDFGPGTLTESGYARTARRWRRGQSIDEAPTVVEVPASDVGVFPTIAHTPEGSYPLLVRAVDFFNLEHMLLTDEGPQRLPLPQKASVAAIIEEALIVRLREDWRLGEETYTSGELLAVPLEGLLAGTPQPTRLLTPAARTTIEAVTRSGDRLLVHMLDNVTSRLYSLTPGERGWERREIDITPLGSVSRITSDAFSDDWFFAYEDFITPVTLYSAKAHSTPRAVRQQPGFFDASGLTVRQLEASSADGTRVPYFLVGPEDAPADGDSPVLLYGYGGFEVSETPSYSATRGIGWLERGGMLAVANIRGGGEFGPGWHQAALRENRMRAYEDFAAVAEDLIERGITRPARLGIMGGSNGGLLVGAAVTQRPDLYGAVVSLVPLLDMRRYHLLLAGASWMGEYGDPDVPEQWAWIRRYSPYQNIDPDADYPSMLLTTSTRDDRVHPGHARKMVARLREYEHPVHYFENIEGGHAGAATPEHTAKLYALVYTYLQRTLEGAADQSANTDQRASR